MRRKLLEQAQHASDELEAAARLAAIVESSSDAMIGKTLDGEITTWNAGAARMYGYSAEEVVGRNISLLIPSRLAGELPAILQRVAAGERVEHYETERLRQSGDVFDASVSISPIRDRTGTIVGASTVTRDITDRKRAEADVRDLQERLHQVQHLESVGQLAGGIAHDFNNLLAGIMNYAALVGGELAELSDRLDLGADETVVTLIEDVGQIGTVAARAARLTHQLLTFSRHKLMKLEILDLNSIVIDMEPLLRRTISETAELETELAADLPCTTADRGQLEQVLMNLVVNARDAMADGGTLRITTDIYAADDDHAHRHGVSLDQYVRLTVSDTGCGMPAEIADRAIEPFFTTKATGEGNGMGLATVYGIVTQVGGQVVISSVPDDGTKIEVILPATDEIATPPRPAPPERPLTSRGETILLVEDEQMVREPTRRLLVRSGYAVLSASNAKEALRIAGDHSGKIALLLTDVVMPGRSGKDLADELRRSSPQTAVLFMSGYTSDVSGLRTTADRSVNLIEKPFASDHLLRMIREVLDTG